MPCRDYESDWGRSNDYDSKLEALQAQNDKLARIACEALTLISQRVGVFPLSTEAANWWKQHQIADKAEQERLAKQKEHNKQVAIKAQKRRELIASMSKEQREILGLK